MNENHSQQAADAGNAALAAIRANPAADYGTDADAKHHQERAERLQRSRDEWRELAETRLALLRDTQAELSRAHRKIDAAAEALR